MESEGIIEAVAHLSEKIDELQAEQNQHNKVTGENLREWSQINASLMNCLERQSEEYQGSASILQMLAQHLLALAHTTQQLTISTKGLEVSSGKLTLYLEESQSPQLQKLDENNKLLQASSIRLEEYLKQEQSQRLSLLENGLRSLLEMIQASQEKNQSIAVPTLPTDQKNLSKHPQNKLAQNHQKSQNFNLASLIYSVILSSSTTTFLLLSLWQFGGVGAEIARISERSEWSLIKLERLESGLGIR